MTVGSAAFAASAFSLRQLKQAQDARIYQGQPAKPPRPAIDAPGCVVRSPSDERILADQRTSEEEQLLRAGVLTPQTVKRFKQQVLPLLLLK